MGLPIALALSRRSSAVEGRLTKRSASACPSSCVSLIINTSRHNEIGGVGWRQKRWEQSSNFFSPSHITHIPRDPVEWNPERRVKNVTRLVLVPCDGGGNGKSDNFRDRACTGVLGQKLNKREIYVGIVPTSE